MFLIFLLLLFTVNTDGAKKGDVCIGTRIGAAGVCTEITTCQKIIEDPIMRKFSPACQTQGLVDIVCCNTSIRLQNELCEPLPLSITSRKTGQKAWDKCVEYQQLVFPCWDGVRQQLCPHDAVAGLYLGSNTHAAKHEFPHAVLLGYTNGQDRLDWLCGGTLISDQFVLTAGHCTTSRVSGPVTHVAVHPSDRSNIDPDTILKVKAIIKHPEFRPPRTYHDIALLELEKPVSLGPTTVPACLLLNGDPPASEESEDPATVIATTWNTNDVLGNQITWLRKVSLTRYSIDECSRIYPDSRRGGFNDSTQLCYGDQTQSRDICQDDGGSAVVLKNQHLSCMYSAVGVASYGRGCFAHSPGVYTRVRSYAPWIESVVWP